MTQLKRKVTLKKKQSKTNANSPRRSKGIIAIVIATIVVIATIFAFLNYNKRKCNSNNYNSDTIVSTIQVSYDKDTITESINASETIETSHFANNGHNNFEQIATEQIEEKAIQVIRGDYGNGEERKNKLGSEYKVIQKRVNEMYRDGLVN